jgi:hypothetical protein
MNKGVSVKCDKLYVHMDDQQYCMCLITFKKILDHQESVCMQREREGGREALALV